MKSYTDIEQSRELAEILPIDSADMAYYFMRDSGTLVNPSPFVLDGTEVREDDMFTYLNCWSLAALLNILPDRTCIFKKTYKDGRVKYQGVMEGNKELILKNNPIDACYEMILRLNELKML